MKLSVLFAMICGLFIVAQAFPLFADCVICNNQAVCNDASKAETLHKCGPPLYISRDESETTGRASRYGGEVRFQSQTIIKETWTYILDKGYRYLYFVGDRLVEVRHGTSAQ